MYIYAVSSGLFGIVVVYTPGLEGLAVPISKSPPRIPTNLPL
jgi:hypothetical protein